MPDPKLDVYENEILDAFDAGELVSVADETEPEELRADARATGTRDRRVSIRLSSADVGALKALA